TRRGLHKEGQEVKEGEDSLLNFLLCLLNLLVNIPCFAISLCKPLLVSLVGRAGVGGGTTHSGTACFLGLAARLDFLPAGAPLCCVASCCVSDRPTLDPEDPPWLPFASLVPPAVSACCSCSVARLPCSGPTRPVPVPSSSRPAAGRICWP